MTRSLMRQIVLDELRALAPVLREWLGPCRRLAWAMYWQRRNVALGRARRADFWAWRVEVLGRRCRDMKADGCTAWDVALRALAIAERIAR